MKQIIIKHTRFNFIATWLNYNPPLLFNTLILHCIPVTEQLREYPDDQACTSPDYRLYLPTKSLSFFLWCKTTCTYFFKETSWCFNVAIK